MQCQGVIGRYSGMYTLSECFERAPREMYCGCWMLDVQATIHGLEQDTVLFLSRSAFFPPLEHFTHAEQPRRRTVMGAPERMFLCSELRTHVPRFQALEAWTACAQEFPGAWGSVSLLLSPV